MGANEGTEDQALTLWRDIEVGAPQSLRDSFSSLLSASVCCGAGRLTMADSDPLLTFARASSMIALQRLPSVMALGPAHAL